MTVFPVDGFAVVGVPGQRWCVVLYNVDISAEFAVASVALLPGQIAYFLQLPQDPAQLVLPTARLFGQAGDTVLPVLRQGGHEDQQAPALQAQAPSPGATSR